MVAESRYREDGEPVSVGYRREAGPAPDTAVARLERQLGRPLPTAYRDYLRQHDGGRLVDNSEGVNEIFGIGPEAPDWASLWQKLDLYAERVPAWLLPVASDALGNLFAVSLRDQDRGSVWFWDHEREADEDEPPVENNVARRAADWRSFLTSLGPPPPVDDDRIEEG
jgi:cell wall assembly regulator SMI1